MAINYHLAVADASPGSAGFSMEGGRATETFYIDSADTLTSLVDILGSCKRAADGTGRLKRKLPKAHPRYNFLFASEITDIRGRGNSDALNVISGRDGSLVSSTTELESPSITSQYWRYSVDAITVSFQPRPYAVLSDDRITTETITWYNDAGVLQTSTVCDEYIRYVEFDYEPTSEFLTYQTGQMEFRTNDLESPHGKVFASFPRIALPKATIRMRWWQVPFRYLLSDDSVIVESIGKVNQLEFLGFAPGTLLFQGVRILRKYTPPVPETVVIDGTTTFSTEKLSDWEFMFEETVRESNSPPAVSNSNWITEGHNLAPWISSSNRWNYVEVHSENADENTPLHLSVPFQLFFVDPDIAL